MNEVSVVKSETFDPERPIRVRMREHSDGGSISSYDVFSLQSNSYLRDKDAEQCLRLLQKAPEMFRLLKWVTKAMQNSSVVLPGNRQGSAFIADANAVVPLQTLISEIEGDGK